MLFFERIQGLVIAVLFSQVFRSMISDQSRHKRLVVLHIGGFADNFVVYFILYPSSRRVLHYRDQHEESARDLSLVLRRYYCV